MEEVNYMDGELIICGLSMEMEIAKELGYVGKCIGCYHLDGDGRYEYCKGELLDERKDDCRDWLPDMR
jgi:hypothetical protein